MTICRISSTESGWLNGAVGCVCHVQYFISTTADTLVSALIQFYFLFLERVRQLQTQGERKKHFCNSFVRDNKRVKEMDLVSEREITKED